MALLKIPRTRARGHDRYAVPCQYLCRADPVLNRLIKAIGPCQLRLRGNHFATLCDSIISQQLSARAAATIFERFAWLYRQRHPTPFEVWKTPTARLRAAGLSSQKAIYVKDLAVAFTSGRIQPRRLARLSNAEIIEAMSSIRGIGRWTAEMFLIFSLNRLDVLPVDDLGIRKAVKRWYGLRTLPTTKRLRGLAKPWTPYETLACWYLWQSESL